MGLTAAGSVIVIACVAALVVTKTSFVPFVKQRWNMQSYEPVDSERSINSISLRDIKVENEAVSEAASSTRSRSPGRTQALP